MELTNEVTNEKPMDAATRAKERRRMAALKLAPLASAMMVMFWLLIPNMIFGFFTSDICMEVAPWVYACGEVLSYVCTLVVCIVLFRLAAMDIRYVICGVLYLVATVLVVVSDAMCGDYWEIPMAAVWLMIVGLCIEAAAGFIEYTAHGEQLDYFDFSLAEKWRRLRIIELIAYALAGIGYIGILAVNSESVLFFIVSLVGDIALIVAGIIRYVYLYQTATTIQAYQAK